VYGAERETVIVGRIESGRVRNGQILRIHPSGRQSRVRELKLYGKYPKSAGAGENIGLVLEEAGTIRRGFLICDHGFPPRYVDILRASLFWLSEDPFEVDRGYHLQVSTQEVRCKAINIESRIDTSTLEALERNATELRIRELGSVIIQTKSPVAVEAYDFIPELGRFVIKERGSVVGAGIIAKTDLDAAGGGDLKKRFAV
jgi:sulfate adenylyltransferase subunit 1 (EFTu-like GTPase family)